ncbi:MAG: hypothetical protein ISP90_05140 [Nevskia sp.]|nr:hypothetical protein [Nevskia sp.]
MTGRHRTMPLMTGNRGDVAIACTKFSQLPGQLPLPSARIGVKLGTGSTEAYSAADVALHQLICFNGAV